MKTFTGPAIFPAQFVARHISQAAGRAFGDVAAGGVDRAANRRVPGIG